VSQLDDQIAAFALDQNCIHGLLSRNIQLAKRNLEILDRFVDSFRWACEWIRPVAGTTAFVKFSKMGQEVDDVAFCQKLMEDTGVMLVRHYLESLFPNPWPFWSCKTCFGS